MEDLAPTYIANFLIYSQEEGDRFSSLKFWEIISCKYFPSSLLQKVGMHDSFTQLLTSCGLQKFVSIHEHTYVELIMEFYTSLEVKSNDSRILEFRMLGK